MRKKIILTGGTGLIGNALKAVLLKSGYDLIILSRKEKQSENPDRLRYFKWNISDKESLVPLIEEAYGVIHLAGEPIANKRWTKEQKLLIQNSRVVSTMSIAKAISEAVNKPEVFIHASATGYYGFDESQQADENSPPGEGFLPDVCIKWENAAEDAVKSVKRKVAIRIGIVLAKDGGALPKLILPFKFFAGSVLGSGEQTLSWIHINDLVRMFIFALEYENVSGILNGTAPNPVSMKELCNAIGEILRRPCFLKVPEFILDKLLGEASVIITKGKYVSPKRVLSAGFTYDYPEIKKALENLIT